MEKRKDIFLINQNKTVTDALKQIEHGAKGILYITNEKNILCGSLTDGDIRRWLINTNNLSCEIKDIMNQNPKFVYLQERFKAKKMIQEFKLNSVPVLNENNEVVDIIFCYDEVTSDKKNLKQLINVPVIIMAGGKGTRLYPYTKILPKPLIPIHDIPIIDRIINKFTEYKITSFYITLNYKSSMIKSYFAESEENRPYRLNYIEENKPLGTGGSIRLIKENFTHPIFITNCDILINADYSDIYEFHKKSNNMLTIVAALKNIILPYGVLHTRKNGTVLSIEEKPQMSYFINTGMYIMNPKAIELIPENTFFHMTDLIDKLIEKGEQIGIYPIGEDSFLDMGEFDEMNKMEKALNTKIE